MALSQQLLSGQNDEWALVRRHESEQNFGVQVAGGYPNIMVPTAEMIGRELKGGVDFVDVNIGCPIDLVFNQGAGSACKFFSWDEGKWLMTRSDGFSGEIGKDFGRHEQGFRGE
jgi:hypothetical protein